MQNFNEFLIENYDMTEEEFYDLEIPAYAHTKMIIWAEWDEYVKEFIK